MIGARCVFVYTTFQLIHKDHLTFFEKKDWKNFGTHFSFQRILNLSDLR